MFEQIIKELKIKVSNMLTRAIVISIREGIKPGAEAGQMFVQIEGLTDDFQNDVELRQQFGFRSLPPKGVRCVLLAYGGDKSNVTAILADSKEIEKTPNFVSGEARQFDDAGGRHRVFNQKHESDGVSYLWKIDDNNKLEFVAGSFKLTVGGEVYTFTSAKLQTTSADVIADTVSLQNHLHVGSPTAAEGGQSNTGQPIP